MMKSLQGRGLLLGVGFAVLAGGCATVRNPTGNGRMDLLTREEIMGVRGVTNLYDVVERLRPRWLKVRAQDRSFGLTTSIVVYQNQTLLGDVETLRQLQPGLAYEMKYLDGTTAKNTLPGLAFQGHVAGAIILSTSPPSGGSG